MADADHLSADSSPSGISAPSTGLMSGKLPDIRTLNKKPIFALGIICLAVLAAITYGGLQRGETAAPGGENGLAKVTPANSLDQDAGSVSPDDGVGYNRRGGRRGLPNPAVSASAPLAVTPVEQQAAGQQAGLAQPTQQELQFQEQERSRALALADQRRQEREEQARRRAEATQAAIEARAAYVRRATESPTSVDVGGGGQNYGAGGAGGASAGGGNGSYTPALVQLQKAMADAATGRGAAGQAGAGTTAPMSEDADPNGQSRKAAFARSLEDSTPRNTVRSTRQGSITPYEVKAGWLIPAAMEHGINSDLPGQLTAIVRQDVYDTATGQLLLIPQGSRLVGLYDSNVAYGQDGLMVIWSRIIFPDASSVDLEGMPGTDAAGYAGFRDEVNNHYGRLIGFGVLTSLMGAAYQLSQGNTSSTTQTPSQVAGQAVGQQLAQMGIEITKRNLRVQPTIEVRPGYQFNVRVSKDLVFNRPYSYGNIR